MMREESELGPEAKREISRYLIGYLGAAFAILSVAVIWTFNSIEERAAVVAASIVETKIRSLEFRFEKETERLRSATDSALISLGRSSQMAEMEVQKATASADRAEQEFERLRQILRGANEFRDISGALDQDFESIAEALLRSPRLIALIERASQPIGVIRTFPRLAELSEDWVPCDGARLLRSDYPELAPLFAKDDVSKTTFNLPDLRDSLHHGLNYAIRVR